MGRKRTSNSSKVTGKSKRAKVAPTNKRLSSVNGTLHFDEEDQNSLKLPFVSQAILVKIYLNKENKPVTGKTIPLDIKLLHDDGNQEVPGTEYKVEGAEIKKDGAATVQVTINTLSKDYKGKEFVLQASPQDSNLSIVEIRTAPFTIVSQRLKISNDAPTLWFKDEGGRDKSMEFQIELWNTLGLHKIRDVPLLVTLHYDTEGYPQARNDDSKDDLQLLQMSRDTDPIIRHGQASVRLRINDVSKNHATHAFIVKIAPNIIKDPELMDVAAAYSTPIVVKSKRNNPKKKKKKIMNGGDGAASSSSSSSRRRSSNDQGGHGARYKKSIKNNSGIPFNMNTTMDAEALGSMNLPVITPDVMRRIYNGELDAPKSGAILAQWGYAVNRFVEKTNRQVQNLLLFNAQVVQPLIHSLKQHYASNDPNSIMSTSSSMPSSSSSSSTFSSSSSSSAITARDITSSPERDAARTLVSSLSGLSSMGSPTPINLGQPVSVRSLSQPPIYGGRGHTQDIIDLLGGRGSSLVGTDGGGGSSSSSSSLSSSSFSNYGNGVGPPPRLNTGSSMTTGESAGEDDSNINQFWTAAQSSSQGAFASASSVSSSSSLTVNISTSEEAIKEIAERGAVALALASPNAQHRINSNIALKDEERQEK